MSFYDWRPYVPVAVRRARALKKVTKLRKEGLDIKPVEIEGRKIARTFWGEAWCDHIESFSDYENRLPRGRTYVRNGSVCHLDIARGEVTALVSGSELYTVAIGIKTLDREKWQDLKNRCAGQIGTLLELLQGKLSNNVMSVVTDRNKGLFPLSGEISLRCTCPDWAVMCKHVAAVLYGIGARLDQEPELLFLLRGVDHEELISAEVGVATAVRNKTNRRRIADNALADVFGIEMPEDDRPAKGELTPHRDEAAPQQSRKTSRISGKLTLKGKAEVAGRTTQTPKLLVSPKRLSRVASSARPVTGKAIAELRAKLGMSRSLFANLLGVSAASIANWEKALGTLELQTRSLDAWNSVKGLTKRQAWRKVGGS